MKNIVSAIILCSFLTISLPTAFAGVLQSSSNEDGQVSETSRLVSSNPEQAPPQPVAPKGPTVKMKLKFKPKEQPQAPPATEEPAESVDYSSPPVEVVTEEEVNGLANYMDTNPHATTPNGTSPFVKQVSSKQGGYKRNPILGYGKAKANYPAGTKFDVQEKSAASQSLSSDAS